MVFRVGALLLFAAYFVALVHEGYRTAGNHSGSPRKHRWTLYFITMNNVLLGSLSLFEYRLSEHFVPMASVMGALLVFSRFALKAWSLRSLGCAFHVHIVTSPDKRLVTDGPFAWVRHPTYASRIFATVGIPLLMNAWGTLAVMGILDLLAIALRIQREEKELEKAYPGEYAAYRRTTGALVPLRSLLSGPRLSAMIGNRRPVA